MEFSSKNIEYQNFYTIKMSTLNIYPQKRVICLMSNHFMLPKLCSRQFTGFSRFNIKHTQPVIIESRAAVVAHEKKTQECWNQLKADALDMYLQQHKFVTVCLERYRNYPAIVKKRLSFAYKQSFKQWFKFMKQNYPTKLRQILQSRKRIVNSRLRKNKFSCEKKLFAFVTKIRSKRRSLKKKQRSVLLNKAENFQKLFKSRRELKKNWKYNSSFKFKPNDQYWAKKLKTRKKLKKWWHLYLQLLKSKKSTDIRKKSSIILFEKESNWKRDIFYQSFWFAKFTNKFIKQGKKHFVETKISHVISLLKKEEKRAPFHSFCKIFHRLKPIANTVPKRVGKLYHNIPIPVTPQRSYKLVLNWFVQSVSFVKEERTLVQRIFKEIVSILTDDRRCFTRKLRNALYLQINENRVYTHFRWV